MGKEVVMTQEGYDKLVEELNYLKTDGQAKIAEDLKTAREHGDLSENAEYDAAKEAEAAHAARIVTIEEQLENAVIIEGKKKKNVVQLGSYVKLYDMTWDETLEYTIVGAVEANIKKNLISNESDLAKGILGRKKGEICEIHTPGGIVKVEIKEVK